ncbi:MAG TPA: T9SS type A sorting domain-containing protein [Puia sp.]|jgi:hypothetical protein
MMTRHYYRLIFFLLAAGPPCLQAQSPGGVSTNLALWVKADVSAPTGSGVLTSWTDQTGHNTFTITGSAAKLINTINFHPIVRFTGTQKLTGHTSITWAECYAVSSWSGATSTERGTVISPTTSGTEANDASRYFFRSGLESNPGNFLFSGIGTDSIGFEYVNSPASNVVNEFDAAGTGNVFNMNGLDARQGSLFGGFTARGSSMTGIPQIGDRSTMDSKLKGDIAEIIVYSGDNATNRNKVDSYLALKYGLTLGNKNHTVNYTSSGNQVFWSGVSGYQHSIFGIGTDVASGLTQTSSNSINSGSGSGTGQSGLGNLVLTTTTALTDQQFLMIGTDSTSLGQETITTAMGPTAAVGSKRLFRTWEVQNTNSVGSVNMSFDLTGLTLSGGTTASNYYLMIDNDGDGNFSTGTQSYIKASSISGHLLNFSGITLKDNVIFTIITLPNTIIPLPTSWESFTAAARQNTADLQWTVSSPSAANPDIDHFEIERSSDAISFAETGSLTADKTAPGTNTAGALSYEYQESLSPGTYYYRIRMVDRDGSSQFSAVRSVTIAGSAAVLQIQPNPIRSNTLQLQIDWPQNSTTLLRIVDRQGSIVLQKTVNLRQGSNQLTMDCSMLAAGLYFVQVKTTTDSRVLSFLKE